MKQRKKLPSLGLGSEGENEKEAEARHHRRVEGNNRLPKTPAFQAWLEQNGLADTCEE